MGVANNYTCYCQLYRFFPVLFYTCSILYFLILGGNFYVSSTYRDVSFLLEVYIALVQTHLIQNQDVTPIIAYVGYTHLLARVTVAQWF